MADLTERACGLLTNLAQIIDVVRAEWMQSGDWSEWDQEQRDALGQWLRDYYAQSHA